MACSETQRRQIYPAFEKITWSFARSTNALQFVLADNVYLLWDHVLRLVHYAVFFRVPAKRIFLQVLAE
jgi:hypothetical protein